MLAGKLRSNRFFLLGLSVLGLVLIIVAVGDYLDYTNTLILVGCGSIRLACIRGYLLDNLALLAGLMALSFGMLSSIRRLRKP